MAGGIAVRAAGRAVANRLRNRNIENQESQPLLSSRTGERLGGRSNRNRLVDNQVQVSQDQVPPEQPPNL